MSFLEDTAEAYAAALANPDSAVHDPTLSEVSARMIAQVERELADLQARDRAADAAALAAEAATAAEVPGAAAGGARGTKVGARADAVRSGNVSSVVFTVRLDPRELDALQRRAAAVGIPPSVLARNLIRNGVQPARRSVELGPAVERLETALAPIETVLIPVEAALAEVGTALAAVRAALPAH